MQHKIWIQYYKVGGILKIGLINQLDLKVGGGNRGGDNQ